VFGLLSKLGVKVENFSVATFLMAAVSLAMPLFFDGNQTESRWKKSLIFTFFDGFDSITAVFSRKLFDGFDYLSVLWLRFACFTAFEVTVGLYFPAIFTLKSRLVPEAFRASIYNLYARFPDFRIFGFSDFRFLHFRIFQQTFSKLLRFFSNRDLLFSWHRDLLFSSQVPSAVKRARHLLATFQNR
jgi:hypothetical protein